MFWIIPLFIAAFRTGVMFDSSSYYTESCMAVPFSQNSLNSLAMKRSRRTNFWILPEPVRGKSSTCTQTFGVFCGDMFARQ